MAHKPSFWFAASLLLQGDPPEEGGEPCRELAEAPEEEKQLRLVAAEELESCLACCSDASVLRPLLAAALGEDPTKEQLCRLASALVKRRWEQAPQACWCTVDGRFSGHRPSLTVPRPPPLAPPPRLPQPGAGRRCRHCAAGAAAAVRPAPAGASALYSSCAGARGA